MKEKFDLHDSKAPWHKFTQPGEYKIRVSKSASLHAESDPFCVKDHISCNVMSDKNGHVFCQEDDSLLSIGLLSCQGLDLLVRDEISSLSAGQLQFQLKRSSRVSFGLHSKLEEVQESAFFGSLAYEVFFPPSLKAIKKDAFKYCSSLERIWVPDCCEIDYNAFDVRDSIYVERYNEGQMHGFGMERNFSENEDAGEYEPVSACILGNERFWIGNICRASYWSGSKEEEVTYSETFEGIVITSLKASDGEELSPWDPKNKQLTSDISRQVENSLSADSIGYKYTGNSIECSIRYYLGANDGNWHAYSQQESIYEQFVAQCYSKNPMSITCGFIVNGKLYHATYQYAIGEYRITSYSASFGLEYHESYSFEYKTHDHYQMFLNNQPIGKPWACNESLGTSEENDFKSSWHHESHLDSKQIGDAVDDAQGEAITDFHRQNDEAINRLLHVECSLDK